MTKAIRTANYPESFNFQSIEFQRICYKYFKLLGPMQSIIQKLLCESSWFARFSLFKKIAYSINIKSRNNWTTDSRWLYLHSASHILWSPGVGAIDNGCFFILFYALSHSCSYNVCYINGPVARHLYNQWDCK